MSGTNSYKHLISCRTFLRIFTILNRTCKNHFCKTVITLNLIEYSCIAKSRVMSYTTIV